MRQEVLCVTAENLASSWDELLDVLASVKTQSGGRSVLMRIDYPAEEGGFRLSIRRFGLAGRLAWLLCRRAIGFGR